MCDNLELEVIANEIDELKDVEELTHADVNRIMVITGRLSGILRLKSKDLDTLKFTKQIDSSIFNGAHVGILFYSIAVMIELIEEMYDRRAARKRHRPRHRKPRETESDRDNDKDEKKEETEEDQKTKDVEEVSVK
jgi:hypothetical protein